MKSTDHPSLLAVHFCLGTVIQLVLTLFVFYIQREFGIPVEPVDASLLSSLIVLVVVMIMAWTPILTVVDLDFRKEPVDDRVVVSVAYVAAAIASVMISDALWRLA